MTIKPENWCWLYFIIILHKLHAKLSNYNTDSKNDIP